MNAISILTIIASYVTMTISLAVANFPTVYARDRAEGSRHDVALEDAKMITGFFTVFPIFWMIYLPLPTIVGTVRRVIEDQVPKE